MKSLLFVLLYAPFFTLLRAEEWQPLLDEKLSQWYVWTGVPDPSLGLGNGDQEEQEPMGPGDPLGIYKAEKQTDGTYDLIVSGKVPASLTTKENFGRYHLKVQVKWGKKKWAPSLETPRDSGIIYHSHGQSGSTWKTWKAGLEYQIQEREFGGFFRIGDVTAEGKMDNPTVRRPRFDPQKNWAIIKAPRYCNRCSSDFEKKQDWNVVEIFVVGNRSVHVINGQVVNVIRRAKTKDADGKMVHLSSGQIQIQSSGSEVTYRGLAIQKINEIPNRFLEFFRTNISE